MKGSHSEGIVVLHTQKTNIVVCWKLVKREEEGGDCDNAGCAVSSPSIK